MATTPYKPLTSTRGKKGMMVLPTPDPLQDTDARYQSSLPRIFKSERPHPKIQAYYEGVASVLAPDSQPSAFPNIALPQSEVSQPKQVAPPTLSNNPPLGEGSSDYDKIWNLGAPNIAIPAGMPTQEPNTRARRTLAGSQPEEAPVDWAEPANLNRTRPRQVADVPSPRNEATRALGLQDDEASGNKAVPQSPATPNILQGSATPAAASPTSALADQNTTPVSRPRLVKPVDPFVKASENLQAIRSAPLDYGTDKAGNPRTGPAKGFGGRVKAGLKTALLAWLHTGNPAAAIGGFGVGAAKPDTPARFRRQRELGEAEQEFASAAKQADAQADIGYKQAQTDLMRQQPGMEERKQREAAREREIDNLRQLYNAQPFFDPKNNADHKALSDQARQLGMVLPTRKEKEEWRLEWRNGELKRINPTTGQVAGLSEDFIDKPRVPVPVTVDGQTVQVPQGRVPSLSRKGPPTEAERRAQRNENRQLRKDEEAAKQAASERRGKAAQEISQLENLRIAATSGPEADRGVALQQMGVLAQRIKETYGDIVEVGASGNWPYAKLKPEAAQSGPGQKQYTLTEQDVRSEAKRLKLDADEMVRRARAAGDIP